MNPFGARSHQIRARRCGLGPLLPPPVATIMARALAAERLPWPVLDCRPSSAVL